MDTVIIKAPKNWDDDYITNELDIMGYYIYYFEVKTINHEPDCDILTIDVWESEY